MSKPTTTTATNSITIVGTLLDVNMREGNSKASGAPYRSGTATIRVDQHYGGKSEVSEIPVNFIAMKFKKDGTINPSYESVSQFQTTLKSAQSVGISDASRVRISGRSGRIEENMYASTQNPENIISVWRLSGSYFNEVRGTGDNASANVDCATFNVDMFITSIARELTKEGEESGRLKIRGAIVQYGNKLDVIDFFVEDASAIDYIERNWNVNDTVNAVGRIRYTSETIEYHSSNSWGEDIPQSTTRMKHELIITKGSDEPFDEDNAYDADDIRALNADRNNRKEQIKIDAKNRASKPAPQKSATADSGYGWE